MTQQQQNKCKHLFILLLLFKLQVSLKKKVTTNTNIREIFLHVFLRKFWGFKVSGFTVMFLIHLDNPCLMFRLFIFQINIDRQSLSIYFLSSIFLFCSLFLFSFSSILYLMFQKSSLIYLSCFDHFSQYQQFSAYFRIFHVCKYLRWSKGPLVL